MVYDILVRLRSLFSKGNTSRFVVFRGGESVVSVPVNVLILFLVFAFWLTFPLIVTGLFFGFNYKFVGAEK